VTGVQTCALPIYQKYNDELNRQARAEAADAAERQGFFSTLAGYGVPTLIGGLTGGLPGMALALGVKTATNKAG
jgi:predicted lipid-binding transport protein (Tim44 family)